MNTMRSSAYRQMQACAVKWLRYIYKIKLLGFDTKVQGKNYSVIGIDKAGCTYAIIIFEDTKDFQARKIDLLMAYGKFNKTMAMFPSIAMARKFRDQIGYRIGILGTDKSSFRGAYTVGSGMRLSGTSKLISLEKLKKSILLRNSESLQEIIEWIANRKGKNVDASIASGLRKKCDELSKALAIAQDRTEKMNVTSNAFYNFAGKFLTRDVLDMIKSLGSRDYYVQCADSSSLDKNGYSTKRLVAAVKTVKDTVDSLNNICKSCGINKGKASDDTLRWSDYGIKCAGCKNLTGQAHMVKTIHRYEALCTKVRPTRERRLK